MTHSTCFRHDPATYVRDDLCARMAPLNSYGLSGVGSALADGLSALASVSRHALSALWTKSAA